ALSSACPPVADEWLHGAADQFNARPGRLFGVCPEQCSGSIGVVRLDFKVHATGLQRGEIGLDIIGPVTEVVNPGICWCPDGSGGGLQQLERGGGARVHHFHGDSHLACRRLGDLFNLDDIGPGVARQLAEPFHGGIEIVDDNSCVIEVFGFHRSFWGVAFFSSCSSHCTSLWFSRPLSARSCSSAARFTRSAAGCPRDSFKTISDRCSASSGRRPATWLCAPSGI